MAELKTKKNDASVEKYIASIKDEQRRNDCETILDLMKKETKAEPKMWGETIVGLGDHHYIYASGRENDWFQVGFSNRKDSITLYLCFSVFDAFADLLEKLGKFKTGKGCLYIKKLEDVHLPTLKKMIKRAVTNAKKMHGKVHG
ncbi:MAG: DUF1801 domain-containing protein [Planctomycetes bacterium]|nr:DUF1801 domain-containing protein [Planctomycetota bacterium]